MIETDGSNATDPIREMIPRFILERLSAGEYRGTLRVAAVSIDISGFTAMTEQLMTHGLEGAEVLSGILRRIFNLIVTAIIQRNGWIIGFAGDSCTALFPEKLDTENSDLLSVEAAIESSIVIRSSLLAHNIQTTRLGNFVLNVKIGIGCGEVEWNILGTTERKTYFFRGNAIQKSILAQQLCRAMDVCIDGKVVEIWLSQSQIPFPYEQFSDKAGKTGYRLLFPQPETRTAREPGERRIAEFGSIKMVSWYARQISFLPQVILEETLPGEFRRVICLFISVKEPIEFDDLQRIIQLTLETVHRLGGYFKQVDWGDKGLLILVFFGCPLAYEDNLNRALALVDTLREKHPQQIRLGITQGMGFTGYVGSDQRGEYSVLGNVVNLAARIMSKAGFGEVLLSVDVARKVTGYYELHDRGLHSLKGFAEQHHLFQLGGRRRTEITRVSPAELVGRDETIDRITTFAQPLIKRSYAGMLFICGEPGIGKSHLIAESARRLNQGGINIVTFQADAILKKSLNLFAGFFVQFLRMNERFELDKNCFEMNYQEFISRFDSEEAISELQRIQSFIAAIIGLEWEGSLYSFIAPQDRPQAYHLAIISFFRLLSQLHPTMMIIEDYQWIDDDSRQVVTELIQTLKDRPLFFVISSRKIDNVLDLENVATSHHLPSHRIILEGLDVESIRQQIEQYLGMAPDSDLLTYIAQKTGGNPFFCQQMCSFLQENNLVEPTSEDPPSTASRIFLKKLPETVEVPENIQAILIARIDRLTHEMKEMIQLAAVLGQEFDVLILQQLIDTYTEAIGEGRTTLGGKPLKDLIVKGEHEQIWSRLSEIRYLFKHALLRDAAYDMQLRERLRQLHHLTANCLENQYQNNQLYLPDISYHYEKAGELLKARDGYYQAACQAMADYKTSAAVDYFSKSKEMYDLQAERDLPFIGQFSHDRGSLTLNQLTQFDEAQDYFEKAREVYLLLYGETSEQYVKVLISLSANAQRQGEFVQSLSYLEKGLAISLQIHGQNHQTTATIYHNLGYIYYYMGHYEQALEILNKALQLRQTIYSGDHEDIAATLHSIAQVYWYMDEGDLDLQFLLQSLAMTVRLYGERHPITAIRYHDLGEFYRSQQDYIQAMDFFQKELLIKQEFFGDNHPFTAISHLSLGLLNSDLGDNSQAFDHLKKALDILRQVAGDKNLLTAYALNAMARWYHLNGDYQLALSHYSSALSIHTATQGETHYDYAANLMGMSRSFLGLKEYIASLEQSDQAISILKSLYGVQSTYTAKAMYLRASILKEMGHYQQAFDLHQQVLAIRLNVLHSDTQAIAQSYQSLGETCWSMNDLIPAKSNYLKALSIFEELRNNEKCKQIEQIIQNIDSSI